MIMSSIDNSYIYVLAPLLAWLTAHIVKFLVIFFKTSGNKRSLKAFVQAGGMPSSHTAVMVALLTVIGFKLGINNAIFGLAITVAVIIIYDALNVRRSVGEQGDVLKKIASNTKISDNFFVAYGHNFTEVSIGAIIGFAIGIVLLQIL